jgi:erythromycin esterase
MSTVNKNKESKHYQLTNAKDLDPLMERIGDARIVLLGEASHGTHEFYTWRTAISKRLIEEKDFNFIAVEGDWPDCYRVNQYIKGYANADKTSKEILKAFNRWPTWMWANWEIAALVSWLKDFNSHHAKKNKIGFYGLDVYSLWESMETLVSYLEKNDPPSARIAERALDCFSGYQKNEQEYAINSLSAPCRNEVLNLLKEIRMKAMYFDQDPEAALNTTQNAHVAVEAEKYYRNMIAFDDHTWNIRDRHMMSTLNRLLDFHGPSSKAIIWEHNTHVGDARFTDMSRAGMFNIGQLAREQYEEKNTVIVGFASYSGAVIAGDAWGAPMREMLVPAARGGSIEEVLHNESADDRLIIFDREDEKFNKVIPHRAIGVVYDPFQEKHNYVPSLISKRYDAFMFIDSTSALHPLHIKPDAGQVPETYPFEF